jgi:uncharacterized protein
MQQAPRLADGTGTGAPAQLAFESGMTMVNKIEQDHQRFRQIIRGRIRKDLRRFIARGEMIGREGKKFVSIPVNDIDIPTFRYGDNSAGVGMGEGDEGETVKPGQGNSKGGEQEGKHILEVDVSLEELADILGEELKLPRIEPKGEHKITTVRDRYTGIRPTGPAALRHFKRSYREALKRQIALGTYDPKNPIVVPIKNDFRFRSWNEVRKPQSNALIVYMMDVSGSMGDEQKNIVRLEAFWIDTWLRRNYEGQDVLFRARGRRNADQLRVQLLQGTPRRPLRPRRLEHLPVPLLRRRQLERVGQSPVCAASREAPHAHL